MDEVVPDDTSTLVDQSEYPSCVILTVCEPVPIPEIVSGVLPLYEPSTYARAPEGEDWTWMEPVVAGVRDNVADMDDCLSAITSTDVGQF
jgi:hypothetical protein